MAHICDVDHVSPASHRILVTVAKLDENGQPSREHQSATFDAGDKAAEAARAGDLHALGQLVPAKYRTKKPAAARKPRAGAAPAALTGALSGDAA